MKLSLALLVLAGPASAQMNTAAAEVRLAPSVGVSVAAPVALSPTALGATGLTTLNAPGAAPALAAPAIAPSAVSAAAPSAAAATAVPAAAVSAAAADAPVSASASAAAGSAAPKALGAASAASAPAADARDAALSGAAFDGGRRLNVLMAAAESVPFIKTGGLADVVNDVSRGLAERGHNVTLVMPKYKSLKLDGVDLKMGGRIAVPMNGALRTAQLWTARVAGVDVVLIDHPELFQNTKGPYDSGSVYGEDANEARWAYYSRAVLEAARAVGFRPDIVHAHDWHAALIPAYLKKVYDGDPFFADTRSVVTIHNIAFQGHYSADAATRIGFNAREAQAGGALQHKDGINYLKAGLVSADAITTVSRTYAREIQEGHQFGMGLENVLSARSADLSGIVNGVDPELWGPSNDPLIAHPFDVDGVAAGKAANKADLQRRMGLNVDPDAPIFSVASRLSHQKGIDTVLDAVNTIVGKGGQLVISGAGDPELEKRVAEIVKFYSYYGRVAFHTFDEAFVHAVYAASDFLLMPSRFEPCGLSQLIAQRYGTIPIVARTGGLADTITDLRTTPETGDGLFIREGWDGGIWATVEDAYAGYHNPEAMAVARRNAMTKDSSWGPALDEYEALFRRLVGAPTNPQ